MAFVLALGWVGLVASVITIPLSPGAVKRARPTPFPAQRRSQKVLAPGQVRPLFWLQRRLVSAPCDWLLAMPTLVSRRRFTAASCSLLAGAAYPLALAAADAPSERLGLGIMGLHGRGSDLMRAFVAQGAAVHWLCDVDQRALARASDELDRLQSTPARRTGDFRRMLDDPAVDALVIAAPDHWHAPATILACAAGKHVYVEKPASHNPREGEWMVAAARRHSCVVQLGTQRRSMPEYVDVVRRVRSGELGRVLLAKAWYCGGRQPLGRGRRVAVPDWLDFQLWQGPAPDRPYQDNLVHYNWHWFWHWGTAELGNNGVHLLDVCRWALGVEYPDRVTAAGGRSRPDDDQETPDTHLVTYDFAGTTLLWEGRSWQRRGPEGTAFGMTFYGDQASLAVDDQGCRVFDPEGRQTQSIPFTTSQDWHLKNFLDAVRGRAQPQAEILQGHQSTLLCHLGNIAFRTGRALALDPHSRQLAGDAEAATLWGREYRPGWDPQV
jgi:predicted dehydrogenase